MCVDAANCGGSCPECISDNIRRLTMANKQLTKMCDQYLAEKQQADTEMTSLRAEVERLTAERDAARECEARMHLNMLEVMEERDRALKEKP